MNDQPDDSIDPFMQDTGEMKARYRALDWSQSNLGPMDHWPQSLRTAAQMVVDSPFPMLLLWGAELIQIYNDGYRELMGATHPAGFGKAVRQCCPEVFSTHQHLYEQVRAGQSLHFNSVSYPVIRSCLPQEAWFSVAYSPVLDESETVAGILITAVETTSPAEQPPPEQAQQALHQQNHFIQTITDMMPDLVSVVEYPSKKIVYSNRDAMSNLGFNAEEIVRMTYAERVSLFHPDDVTKINEFYNRFPSLQDHEEAWLEYRVRNKNGTWITLRLRGKVFQRNGQGEVTHTLFIAHDITESKKAEQEITDQARFINQIAQVIPDILSLVELPSRKILYSNQVNYALHGFNQQELVEMPLETRKKLIHPEDLPALNNFYDSFTVETKDHEVHQVKYRTKNTSGDNLILFARGKVFQRDEDGRIKTILIITQNITETEQSALEILQLKEDITQRTEDKLRLAVEASDMYWWEIDLHTFKPHYSVNAELIVGAPPAETYEENILFLHPDDREIAGQAFAEAMENGTDRFSYEVRSIAVPTETRWFYVSGKLIRDQQNRPALAMGISQNVTAQRQSEQALLDSDRRKDEFLAMLAHELRNPMSTVRNGLAILALKGEQDRVNGQILGMMNRQVDHLVRMVDDLLDVSRISWGKIDLKYERVELGALVRSAVEDIRPQYVAQQKKLHLQPAATTLYAQGDVTRLFQLITNLLTNGLRYTGDEGEVWVTIQAENHQAVLRVTDNGIGLSANQLDAIFELFVQVDHSVARSQGGLGIGLTLVKRLVQLHDGRVEAHSDGLGKGSEFVVWLPLLEEAEHTRQPHTPTASTAPNQRILVIDDNPDAALSLSILLELKGYEVHTRKSGREGIRAAEELQPAAILCDIGMPELDGYQTCRLIREQPWGRTITIIALTGYGREENRQKAEEAGFDGHVLKPVNPEELQRLLVAGGSDSRIRS